MSCVHVYHRLTLIKKRFDDSGDDENSNRCGPVRVKDRY